MARTLEEQLYSKRNLKKTRQQQLKKVREQLQAHSKQKRPLLPDDIYYGQSLKGKLEIHQTVIQKLNNDIKQLQQKLKQSGKSQEQIQKALAQAEQKQKKRLAQQQKQRDLVKQQQVIQVQTPGKKSVFGMLWKKK